MQLEVELRRFFEEVQGFAGRGRSRGLGAGAEQERLGAIDRAAHAVVVRQHAGVAGRILGNRLLHRLTDPTMERLAARVQQALIGHLLDERVLEGVLAPGGPVGCRQELRVYQRLEVLTEMRGVLDDVRQHLHGEGLPDHRGRLQELPLPGIEAIDAGHHQLVDRAGDGDRSDLLGRTEPALDVFDRALVDERADDLLDVEGIAPRLLLDQLTRRVWQVFLPEQMVEHAPGAAGVERAKLDLEVA